MTNQFKFPTTSEPQPGPADQQFRRDRRKLFADALVGVPVILTLTSKPLWAVVADNATNTTGARYMHDPNRGRRRSRR